MIRLELDDKNTKGGTTVLTVVLMFYSISMPPYSHNANIAISLV